MKRDLAIFLTVCIASMMFGVTSCKRQAPDTPFGRMLGKWKKVKYATDDNRNGIIDKKEIFLVESGVDNEILFRKDSTGVETTNSDPPSSFRWQIVGDASVLVQYTASDTITYSIENVSSGSLTLTTSTQFGLAWYYYIKK
jgi:hypothetical protein